MTHAKLESKWRRGAYCGRGRDWETSPWLGWVRGPFGICQLPSCSDWHITHLPSGFKVFGSVRRKSEAQDIVAALLEITTYDWWTAPIQRLLREDSTFRAQCVEASGRAAQGLN